ncbi:MAG: hypothetical protein NC898_03570 [Candidatus Omnitrophica bacterium]|nr:hypothetical protein [Candidatus Omnitrophota bacterium]MCM8793531.1 hypothetical protein [Candidatus Omnitrophota bacterium]
MREIIFKNLQNLQKGQKNIFVSETLSAEGILCHSERRSIYIIKEKMRIDDPLNLEGEVEKLQQKNHAFSRQLFIRKKIDTLNHTKEFAYSLLGRFYVVVQDEIYTIAFKHSFKLSLTQILSEKT